MAAGRRLTVQDERLPRMREALDSEGMAGRFEALFAREYPERGLVVDECRISKIYYRPGRKCNIVYRLRGRDRDRRGFDAMFRATIRPDVDGATAARLAPSRWPGCGFWKPLLYWPELGMTVSSFPYDRGLPHLSLLLSPEFVREQIEEASAAFGLPEWRCTDVVWDPIKWRPGKSSIIRYQAAMRSEAGEKRELVFYGKTYQGPQSRYVYEVLREVWASPARRGGPLDIPRPITHLDAAHTIWQEAWEGERLNLIASRIGWESVLASSRVERIGRALAGLHQVEVLRPLQPGPSPEVVLDSIRENASDVAHFSPDREATLARSVRRLGGSAPSSDGGLPKATIHGAFRIAQILCRDDQVAFVDFDAVAEGDPLYDLGELVASFVYKGTVNRGLPASLIEESVEGLLEAYEGEAPWRCDPWRLAWYTASFLLAKVHASLKGVRETANVSAALELVEEWVERAAGPAG